MSGYIGTQPVPQATQHRETFTATASQTTFATVGYTPQFVDVYLNGVHLLDTVDYTATNSSDVVLTTGAAASDVVEIISYTPFEVANQTFTGTTTVDVLTATGAVAIGDGLTVDGIISTTNGLDIDMDASASGQLKLDGNGYGGAIALNAQGMNIYTNSATRDVIFGTNETERMRIDGSGDVGIGTASPISKLHVDSGAENTVARFSSTDSVAAIYLTDSNTTGTTGAIHGLLTTGDNLEVRGLSKVELATGTTTKVTVDTSGNVGIGTSSPSYTLDVNGGTNNIVASFTSTDTNSVISFGDNTTAPESMYLGAAGNDMLFNTNGAEAMRIDSSGNVLVGKTSSSGTNVGVELRGSGVLTSVSSSAASAIFNREGTDGSLVNFKKSNVEVGSIGVQGNYMHIVGNVGTAAGLKFVGNSYIRPCDGSGGQLDNQLDLGFVTSRFDDVYATNGTIQTSDRNEKQQIAALTDAEMQAAKAISAGFKTFKWNDSVAEKGAEARTHSGVIAQEVEQALTDAGLDAGDYAFFISNTWWETHTEVPAVEAVAEVLDAEGVVITEAVEAKEAYTRTDTYHTLAEAPEGATERTRKGIRYPQLLAFVGAATEQRLASIETRLTALEVTP